MKHLSSSDSKWVDKEGYSKRIFLDEKDIKKKGILFQQLRVKSGEVTDTHFHKKQTEIFYFLNNNGYFVVNSKKLDINVGDILVIEPYDIHEVVNDKKEDFIYLAFKFDWVENDYFIK